MLAALAFIPVTYWMMNGLTFASGVAAPHWWKFYLCALIGIGVTACLFVITDYYTSTRFAPVKSTARASQTGHATNIIQGLAQGFQSTAPPAIVIALGILGAWKLAGGGTQGIYGIGVAVMAQLSLTGLIVALDAFGPITDNAGGIAEMADLPEEVRNVTDPLDAVGNTTKAVTKGYAIGSAALAALVLFDAFETRADRRRASSELLARQPGGADRAADRRHDGVPVRVAGDGGGRTCRRQGRRGGAPPVPGAAGDHGGDRAARVRDGRRTRDACGAARDDPPALIPIVVPLIVGLISIEALGGLLIGVIVVGLFMAISMTSGGGAWDNAKKLIEDGAYGGKGSEAHAAAVTGDTVGDPYKDTAGPAINPMIKVANIVALLIIPMIT